MRGARARRLAGTAAVLVLGCAVLVWLAWPGAREPGSAVVVQPAPSEEPALLRSPAEGPERPARTEVAASAPIAEPAVGLTVRGRVLDADTMQPLVEARVFLASRTVPQTPGTVDLGTSSAEAVPAQGAAGEALTDEHGRFTFSRSWTKWMSIHCDPDGYAPGVRTLRAPPGASGVIEVGDVLLERERSRQLRIVIVDETDRPFGGAMAFYGETAWSASKGRWSESWSPTICDFAHPAARADEGGRLELSLSPSVHDVLLVHPEAPPTKLEALDLLRSAASPRQVRLARGTPATVRVARRSERISEQFRVTVALRELQVDLLQDLSAGEVMRCGALGLLHGETCRTDVRSIGGRCAEGRVRHDFATEPNLTVPITDCLAGRVTVHWDPALPRFEKLVVGLIRESRTQGTRGHAQDYLLEVHDVQPASGPLHLHPVPERYAVCAFSPSLGFWRSHRFDLGPEDVELRAERWTGGLRETTIRVLRPDGSPVPDCRLELSFGGGNPEWPVPLKFLVDVSPQALDAYRPFRRQARTDRNGTCVVAGLPAGRLTLMAAAPGMGEARVEVPRVVPEIRVVLDAAGALHGSVRSRHLGDLYRACAYVTSAGDDVIGGPTSPIDAEGRFAIDGLPAGHHQLRLVVPSGHSLGSALRLHPASPRYWELARTTAQVVAGETTTVELVADDEACSPKLVVQLGAVTSGTVEITQILGPHGDAGWEYELPIQQQDALSIIDLAEVRHLVRATTAAGEAWAIVLIGGTTSTLALDPESPRRIEFTAPRIAQSGEYRLVPCTSDGSSWAGCAGVPVRVDVAGTGTGTAAVEALVSGDYLVQARQGRGWKPIGRLRVRGEDVAYEPTAPR